MGRINLITGTASGKIGQFQYQTHGMKCVVRTKQPDGLTNDQAELVNKPILLNLSSAYRQWAKFLLTTYPSDWSKPQALWNYYTKCNKPIFDGTAEYDAGFAVVLHGLARQYTATYTVDQAAGAAFFQFDEPPVSLDHTAQVVLIHGLVSGPPEQWETTTLQVTEAPQIAPLWNETEGSENIGFFLLDRSGRLYGGVTLCTVKGNEPTYYFAPSPAEIAANMLVFEELSPETATLQIRLDFNTAFMPEWINGKSIRYTTHQTLIGHPSGTSWTATYNPQAVFIFPETGAISTFDPLLEWVILDGAEEKSDRISLTVSEVLPPPGFFEDVSFTVYQEESNPGLYYAMFWCMAGDEDQGYFLLNVYANFTGQGSIAPYMPENPMFYIPEDFPYLWIDRPKVSVPTPCGTAQLVLGDHPGDSRYNFGPPFAVGYEEN
jgi:hypothetical protein